MKYVTSLWLQVKWQQAAVLSCHLNTKSRAVCPQNTVTPASHTVCTTHYTQQSSYMHSRVVECKQEHSASLTICLSVVHKTSIHPSITLACSVYHLSFYLLLSPYFFISFYRFRRSVCCKLFNFISCVIFFSVCFLFYLLINHFIYLSIVLCLYLVFICCFITLSIVWAFYEFIILSFTIISWFKWLSYHMDDWMSTIFIYHGI